MAPAVLTRPNVVRSPVTLQTVDGSTIEPIVSVPIANATRPAAVAAAGPHDEPPLPVEGSQGLRVWPPNQRSPLASAPVASLATRTAPA